MAISAPARSTSFKRSRRTSDGHFDAASALGSLSLIFWTLIIVVSLKYALVVMRADNRGEGGILALMSLTRANWRGRNRYLLACGLIGAALLYGDGMITPAISVLSARRGAQGRQPDFAPYTMPIAARHPAAVFVIQHYGTAAVGRAFGPLMLLWFVCHRDPGWYRPRRAPHVIVAVNPLYAASLPVSQGIASLAILGAVFLCVTGAEAHVRRHGASRPHADPDRLDGNRAAGLAAQLRRPDRPGAEGRRAASNPFFMLRPIGCSIR